MTFNGILQIVVFVVILALITKPLGLYMARVYQGKPIIIDRVLGPFEHLIYRICGTSEADEMNWKQYAVALLVFNLLGILLLYALHRLQGSLPLNPQGFAGTSEHLAFDNAISFGTNTNWQSYGGEVTLSYLTQMLGLAVQNFLSAATGMVVIIALIRGITRHSAKTIGNFWVDMTKSTLYILLPLSIILAIVLVSQGVVQNFSPYQSVNLVQPTSFQSPYDTNGNPLGTDANGAAITRTVNVTTQLLPMGPAASQIAIKQLGTNGGGYFNANSGHPYENPTPLSDLLEILAVPGIAAALTYTYGSMVGDTRQGWAIFAAMMILYVILVFTTYAGEAQPNPKVVSLGVANTISDTNPGVNMEGKEVRFGIARSALFDTTITVTSAGATNAALDSMMPIAQLAPIFAMHLGETVFGGVGTGMTGMLAMLIIAVFVAGLMVGRTPEYLGKKIEIYEMKMASVAILIMPALVLIGMAVALMIPAGRGTMYDANAGAATIYNPGAQGFNEVMYAFTSAANNNGSAMGGLGANTPFYNIALGIVMLFGRYWPILAILALAGSLVKKKISPPSSGTLPTHTGLFIVMLLGVVVIVGALSFFPVLALGPIVEHLKLF
jgi:potassium-transporting ATPase potassium-binding subunit